MAERETRQLGALGDIAVLARAIHAAPSLDTSTMACLSGRWPSGPLIAFGCREVVGSAAQTLGGGWLGWQAYQPEKSWWGRFEIFLRQNAAGRWRLEVARGGASDPDALTAAITDALVGWNSAGMSATPAAIRFAGVRMTEREAHLAAVERAISAIRAGQLYQVNVCARIGGELHGDPLELFSVGITRFAPDHAAYLHTPRESIVSFSPELFLRRQGRLIESAPIKGTRQRTPGSTATQDPAALELRRSAKDRAENVMIVDLMRNDLSRVCSTGSVWTPRLLDIRPAPGVWHLVSEVCGQLRPDVSDCDLLAAAFPPGSVTGAPKSRATSLIEELEVERRGVFTGAIGYLGIDDGSALNVAIRTFEVSGDGAGGQRFELGAGGGITADSVPSEEWRECLIKAAPLLALGGVELDVQAMPAPEVVDPEQGVFDTLIAHNEKVAGLADHLTRLEQSALELYRSTLPSDLGARILALASGTSASGTSASGTSQRSRLRVVAAPAAGIAAELRALRVTVAISEAGDPPTGAIALRTMAGRSGNWRHKWNDRRYLAGIESRYGDPGAALPLFVDDVAAVVHETSRSNIAVVSVEGVLCTPALGDDVLPGITRRRLLDAAGDRGWVIRLGPVLISDLLAGRLVLSLNSGGIVAVESLDGRPLTIDNELLAEIRGWFAGEFG
ncbi:MAG: para-aminobenzoate synthetase / 4-amino-4-deoxychorismate lyase [Pseudonocardiales bacterium]|nr:para-aminobenzoate synthetase / 4-amino-4-deoxychorismate lyase [Pseudonocardiales bacterium]